MVDIIGGTIYAVPLVIVTFLAYFSTFLVLGLQCWELLIICVLVLVLWI
jgi:hypothetical protein